MELGSGNVQLYATFGSGENLHKAKIASGKYIGNGIFVIFHFFTAVVGPLIAKKPQ